MDEKLLPPCMPTENWAYVPVAIRKQHMDMEIFFITENQTNETTNLFRNIL